MSLKRWPTIPDPTQDVTQQVTVLQSLKNVVEMITGQRAGAPAPMVRLYKTYVAPGSTSSPIPIQQLRDGDLWINRTVSPPTVNFWDPSTQSWVTCQ